MYSKCKIKVFSPEFAFDLFEDPADDHVGLLICPEVLDKVVPNFVRKADVSRSDCNKINLVFIFKRIKYSLLFCFNQLSVFNNNNFVNNWFINKCLSRVDK